MRVECESRLKKNRPGDGIMVVVAIGINDSRFIDSEPETKIEQFTENIVEIRDVALEYGDRVFFVSLTPVDEDYTLDYEGTRFIKERILEFNTVFKEKCNQAVYIDVYSHLVQWDLKDVLDDGLIQTP